jgi:hypothetical protein
MGDAEFLQQHTDAAKESSNRTRQILLLMIIARSYLKNSRAKFASWHDVKN